MFIKNYAQFFFTLIRFRTNKLTRFCSYTFFIVFYFFYPINIANASYELLVFTNASFSHLNESPTNTSADQDTTEIMLDIFVSTDYYRYRFLSDYVVSEDEREAERLQLGWLLNPNLTLWLGRFHDPIGFWNTKFHHGNYLRISTGHPSIVEFEDDEGILPIHVSGILLEGIQNTGDSGIRYSVALGLAPDLMTEGLEPYDFWSGVFL